MRIYKMTATFGKLDNQTLTLEPGLNILTAPNEWGKSTWCAFLMAMLYGLDTRAKSTRTQLADKDRYAPWSGSPMEGRIDLHWKGRDITIQRKTLKRIPLGDFSAFETATGLPVPELTAANCGQLLLGVEQSVYRRAGFIRQADLPVTQDEALRRRLNALVTTGDESDRADKLAENLKDLKNRCRYNKSGLLPQAEQQYAAVQQKLTELTQLEQQQAAHQSQLAELKTWQDRLQLHRQHLQYHSAEQGASQIAQARLANEQAQQLLRQLETSCAQLPSQEESEHQLRELRAFRDQWNAIQMEKQLLPESPQPPRLEGAFRDMDIAGARAMVTADSRKFTAAQRSKIPTVLLVMGILGLTGAAVLGILKIYIPAAMAAGASLAAIAWGFYERSYLRRQIRTLAEKYGSGHPGQWTAALEQYVQNMNQYQAARKRYQDAAGDLDVRCMVLQRKREALCGSDDPNTVLEYWQQVRSQWDAYHTARREAQRAQGHLETLGTLVQTAERPAQADTMTGNEAQTAALLAESVTEQQRLQNRLGQIQGRMEALGARAELESQLQSCAARIGQLEQTYSALSIALETLADARSALQRRFAPRITRLAQQYLGQLTGGRYQSLTIGEDFTLRAATSEEAALRELLWRSDGTMDQLYLAVRLAVAQELTPGTPLVLDDALIRFDDVRMAQAVALLKDFSAQRQVLLFTCQSRESSL